MSLYYEKNHIDVDMSFIGIEDHYVTFGDNESLYKQEHISLNDLKNKIEEIKHEKKKELIFYVSSRGCLSLEIKLKEPLWRAL